MGGGGGEFNNKKLTILGSDDYKSNGNWEQPDDKNGTKDNRTVTRASFSSIPSIDKHSRNIKFRG